MRPLVVANWKMNGSEPMLRSLVQALGERQNEIAAEVVLALPAPFFSLARALLHSSGITWGGQNIHSLKEGAFTGEISGKMLTEMGGRWSLIGHSERRAFAGETDELVADKVLACLDMGLTPIVCLGERLEDREQGKTIQVIDRQLQAIMSVVRPEEMKNLVFAYEPIWAIGTGRDATPEMAQAVHHHLKDKMVTKGSSCPSILYGGSVKAENVSGLLAMPDIDGVLVGGASLDPEGFAALCVNAGQG